MGKRKFFFFDIDGTLAVGTPGDQYVPESTKLALRKLEEQGHFLAIATGRSYAMAKNHMEELGFKNMVSDGGNGITIDSKLLEIKPLDYDKCLRLIDECKEKGFIWAISPDNDLRGEYNVLLKAERDGNLTPEQKGRLFDIREALKKIRKFPEKVIKYLWDDAFKFNPEALFDTDNMESLEQVIRTFVYSTGRDRFKIFKPTVRSTFYPDSQA